MWQQTAASENALHGSAPEDFSTVPGSPAASPKIPILLPTPSSKLDPGKIYEVIIACNEPHKSDESIRVHKFYAAPPSALVTTIAAIVP